MSTALYVLLFVVPLVFIRLFLHKPPSESEFNNSNPFLDEQQPPPDLQEKEEEKEKSIMQPAATDLNPPKDDPFTLEQLKQYDGSDESKPIYLSIKGTVFDVTKKKDVYGPGRSYNIFAGKDGSKGLGKSSLKPEDAVPDYSDLPENELKVLNDWHSFFSKRYNIVGRVVDLPPAVAGNSNQ